MVRILGFEESLDLFCSWGMCQRVVASLSSMAGDIICFGRCSANISIGARTQALFQSLHVATLGAALPPLLIIGTRVTESGASATAGADAITLQLAFPTYHASQTLRFRYGSILRNVVVPVAVADSGVDVVGGALRPFSGGHRGKVAAMRSRNHTALGCRSLSKERSGGRVEGEDRGMEAAIVIRFDTDYRRNILAWRSQGLAVREDALRIDEQAESKTPRMAEGSWTCKRKCKRRPGLVLGRLLTGCCCPPSQFGLSRGTWRTSGPCTLDDNLSFRSPRPGHKGRGCRGQAPALRQGTITRMDICLLSLTCLSRASSSTITITTTTTAATGSSPW